ncbi:MAG: hypothetical protein GPOALKHO_001754 [Sodalis sp.]|nr:MAG: hypothetical protein GPOALKHO_001754 [Sodalis sp.]
MINCILGQQFTLRPLKRGASRNDDDGQGESIDER